MLEMPFGRNDMAEEPSTMHAIGDQSVIKRPDVPTIKHMADIENDSTDLGAIPSADSDRRQPWRALKRRLVLLITYVRP